MERSIRIVLFLCAAVHILTICSFAGEQPASVKKTVFIPQLGESIDVFNSILLSENPRQPFREFLAAQDLSWAKNVLDIGTGSGVLAFIAIKQGVGHVIATDILPQAIDNVLYTAKRMGYSDKISVRLVAGDKPGAYSVIGDEELFDLIISNPPWDDANPEELPVSEDGISPYSYNDNDYQLLKSIISGLRVHLKTNGRAWLYLGRESMVNTAIKAAGEAGLAISMRSPGVLYNSQNISDGVVLYTILELMLP